MLVDRSLILKMTLFQESLTKVPKAKREAFIDKMFTMYGSDKIPQEYAKPMIREMIKYFNKHPQ